MPVFTKFLALYHNWVRNGQHGANDHLSADPQRRPSTPADAIAVKGYSWIYIIINRKDRHGIYIGRTSSPLHVRFAAHEHGVMDNYREQQVDEHSTSLDSFW
jgi:hypothetical protein